MEGHHDPAFTFPLTLATSSTHQSHAPCGTLTFLTSCSSKISSTILLPRRSM